jgi:hypothetical protein
VLNIADSVAITQNYARPEQLPLIRALPAATRAGVVGAPRLCRSCLRNVTACAKPFPRSSSVLLQRRSARSSTPSSQAWLT